VRLFARTGVVAAVLLLTVGCGSDNVLTGRIKALQAKNTESLNKGAIQCAPRELAMAQAHTRFADIELSQGFISKAKSHLDIAELNAAAAEKQTDPTYCKDRDIKLPPKVGDRDGDGFLDPEDSCPDDPENYNGFKDGDGCPDDPDTDGDGIPDSLDQCPTDPEDKDDYLDSDGCPEPDNDLDGIPDAKDLCKNDPEDPDGFEDEDGCPELDNDKDTVVDLEDMCPNEPGDPKGTPKGCPGKSLVVVTDKEVKITQQIHFETGKSTIRKESFPILDAVADVMSKFPDMKLEVQGHTDNMYMGKQDTDAGKRYNAKLSQDRANAVRDYLIKKKSVASSRLTAVGYGQDKPIVPNDADVNRALNRRVQFLRTEVKPTTTP
jgi:outer membrane protein OmpA-like peptidoglycan-associated protein